MSEKGSILDERSAKNIATLHPAVQVAAKLFLRAAQAYIDEKNPGITIKIISAHRTYAEQNALYAKGRTKPGSRVTNASAGYSNHNFGLAFDIGFFRGNAYLAEHDLYRKVGPVGQALGLEWGGSWKSFQDLPHYQLIPRWAKDMKGGTMLAEFRKIVNRGADIFEA